MAPPTDLRSPAAALEGAFETYRRELTGYCYRMLGSSFEAEDAVQETMVRAWRAADRLESRGALRSWLYKIATNVCYDMLERSQKRARPMDMGPASSADAELGPMLPESVWLQPMPDGRVMPPEADPAELAQQKETLRLAFVAALQHLPARQRAVLILREVLRWQAAEVAELLGTSVASVNSALQRARATLEQAAPDAATAPAVVASEQQELLTRYIDAFERYDMSALVELLHEDATFCMPPWELWLEGPDEVRTFMLGTGAACEGSRTIVTSANGCPAFGAYKPAEDGGFDPWSITVLEVERGRIATVHNFIDPALFPAFGLPQRLEPGR